VARWNWSGTRARAAKAAVAAIGARNGFPRRIFGYPTGTTIMTAKTATPTNTPTGCTPANAGVSRKRSTTTSPSTLCGVGTPRKSDRSYTRAVK